MRLKKRERKRKIKSIFGININEIVIISLIFIHMFYRTNNNYLNDKLISISTVN